MIAFDGPGQGRALDDGLPMTPAWHVPVSAVLDYFGVERVTLIGLSLGGCLALRAAAAEPRVARVVAFDALTDFLDVVLRQTSAPVHRVLRLLLRLRAARGVNWMVARAARRSPVVQWGVEQGMHVTGASTAFDFLRCVAHYRTTDISASIRQDVLLLAGRADHYVPVEQWRRQIAMLEHARSITARLFTADEHAENHCQVGNQGLALRTIVQWLDGIEVEHSANLGGP